MSTIPEITGAQFGVEITKREKGQSDLITLYSEDDEYWHKTYTFAAFWIDDLIEVLQKAREKADCKVVFKT